MKRYILSTIATLCLISTGYSQPHARLSVEPVSGSYIPCLANNLACSIVLSMANPTIEVAITNHSKTVSAKSIIVVEAPPEPGTIPVSGILPPPFDPQFTNVVYGFDPAFVPTPCFHLPNFELPPGKNARFVFLTVEEAPQ